MKHLKSLRIKALRATEVAEKKAILAAFAIVSAAQSFAQNNQVVDKLGSATEKVIPIIQFIVGGWAVYNAIGAAMKWTSDEREAKKKLVAVGIGLTIILAIQFFLKDIFEAFGWSADETQLDKFIK